MFRWVGILLCCILAVGTGSCSEEEKTWTVVYSVDPRGGTSATFRVRYKTQNQTTREEGPFTEYWESAPITEFADGEAVSLEVERISGNAQFEFAILRNGAVHESGSMAANENSGQISDQL